METPEFFFTFGNGFIYIFGHTKSCRDPGSSISTTPAVEARSLNYWTGRYVSKNIQQQRWVGVGSVSKDVHKTIIQKIHTPLCYSSTIHNSQDVETI